MSYLTDIVNVLENNMEFVLIGVAVLVLILLVLLILTIVNLSQIKKLKKKYTKFMSGSNAQSLEETITEHLNEIDGLISSNARNEKNIDQLKNQIRFAFQKVGLVKYDAFQEMGGKLSFSLCLLNEKEDGFIINAMHSREGCYTYIKEIIAGNCVIILSEEEKEALEMAKAYK
ncbi:MAG: DUF4446 family protein [bacterium]|nr:DUF4446 family protein [bacterium]MDY4100027.1 DUF4446 family protein [Lachnospiraceae bacterium]